VDGSGAGVRILGGPGNVKGIEVVAGAGAKARELGGGRGQVHLDPAVGGVACPGRNVAEPATVGHDQSDAEQTLTGQVDVRRAVTVGVLAEWLPGLALIAGQPDFHAAHAAGPDLVDLVSERYVSVVQDHLVGRLY